MGSGFTQWEFDKSQDAICCLLAAEGLDDYVIKLISTPLPHGASNLVPAESVDRWRGYILRSVIRAYLALDTKRSANAALDLYEKVLEEKKLAKRRRGIDHYPIASVRLLATLYQLRDAICSGQFTNTSPKKFDRLISNFEGLQPVGLPICLAQLHLYHPTKPTADRFFALCKQDKAVQGSTAAENAMKEHPKFKIALIYDALRASAVLCMQGRPEEAQWLDEYRTKFLGTLKPKHHKARPPKDQSSF